MAIADNSKALFMDLDGTLLDDDKHIPEENRKALDELLEKGHKAIITTGRPLPSAVKQAHKLGLTEKGCYLIAYNGGVLYDTFAQKVLFEQTIPLEYVRTINEETVRRGIHTQAYDRDSVLVEPRCDNDIVRYYCGRIEMPFRVIDSIESITEEPAKLLLIERNDKTRLYSMQEWIRERFDSVIDTFFSSNEFLEVVSKNLNKGNGLIQLAELLQIPMDRTVAIGDEENDVSMLKAAGIGCAMCNGSPEALAAADYITKVDNNHGGAAEAIRRFILDEGEN